MLKHDPEIDGKLIHHGDTDTGPDGEAKAEILALGVGRSGSVGKQKTDTGFEVRDNGPVGLDEVVAWAEEATGEPRIGTLESGGEHAAEKKFGVATIPALVADFVQLPPDRDQLRKVDVVVRVVDGEQTGGFGGESNFILPKKSVLDRFGVGEGGRSAGGGGHLRPRPTSCE